MTSGYAIHVNEVLMRINWFGNIWNLCSKDLIIAKHTFMCYMLPLLKLEADFFKYHNLTSGKVGSSLIWIDIKNIMTKLIHLRQLAISFGHKQKNYSKFLFLLRTCKISNYVGVRIDNNVFLMHFFPNRVQIR